MPMKRQSFRDELLLFDIMRPNFHVKKMEKTMRKTKTGSPHA